MAPQGEAYNIDWICSNTSNVHVANHRDWFTTFSEFKTKLGSIYFGPDVGPEVLGVGDVELELVKSVSPAGRKSFQTIVLKDVLYAPECVTNIFAGHLRTGYRVDFNHNIITAPETGLTVGLVDSLDLCKVWLKGQPRGKSSLEPDTIYMINATWAPEERARYEAHKKSLAVSDRPRYNAAEKEWMKKHFGGEFQFLRRYGLSIYKDEDREEGKQIVTSMMEHDMEDDDEEEEEEEENSFLADLEADPASHLADYHFSDAELDWIEKHHRHSAKFLRVYGLKPWDDEDCEEGKAIIQAFLENDLR